MSEWKHNKNNATTVMYGSVCEYLVSAGFTEEEQDKLRALFLHPEEQTD